MRRRLSDADELAFWHLGLHCAPDEGWSRFAHVVHVADGWAWATDAYRLLCVPVEADWTGTVDRHDALLGGTVTVDDPSEIAGGELDRLFRTMATCCHHHQLTIGLKQVEEMRPWCRRRPQYSPGAPEQWRTVAFVNAGAVFGATGMPSVILPGARYRWGGPHRSQMMPFAVEAPYLASVCTALVDLAGSCLTITGDGHRPAVISPAVVDEGDLVPWGAVMPLYPRGGLADWPRPERIEAAS